MARSESAHGHQATGDQGQKRRQKYTLLPYCHIWTHETPSTKFETPIAQKKEREYEYFLYNCFDYKHASKASSNISSASFSSTRASLDTFSGLGISPGWYSNVSRLSLYKFSRDDGRYSTSFCSVKRIPIFVTFSGFARWWFRLRRRVRIITEVLRIDIKVFACASDDVC